MLLELFPSVILIMSWLLYKHIYSALMGQSTGTQLFVKQANTLPTHCRHFEHMHEAVWLKIIIDKMTAIRTWTLFSSLY